MEYALAMSDALLEIDNEKPWTYADYKGWQLKEGERYEIVHGVAYAMSAPSDAHQAALGELFRQIATYLRGKPCKARPAPYDVRLFYQEDESDTTVVQPDISVICDAAIRGSEGCRGAPDWIIEVLSPSTTADDYVRKFNLYLEAGVREYWIVSPEKKAVYVYLFKDGAAEKHFSYEIPTKERSAASKGCILSTSAPSNTFKDFSINLVDVFAE
jgi:Uma2 family endonuclease